MDEDRMADWWKAITGEHKDAWCNALDRGTITTEMAMTIQPGFRDQGPHDWLTSTKAGGGSTTWTMTADFQAYIAEQCDQRLR